MGVQPLRGERGQLLHQLRVLRPRKAEVLRREQLSREADRVSDATEREAVLADALAVPPAALLIADPATADLVTRLASDISLTHEVCFFLDALDAEPDPPPEPPE